jgi:GNAT superfamily N-acetyltransferase
MSKKKKEPIIHLQHSAYMTPDQVKLVFEGMTEILKHHPSNLNICTYSQWLFHENKGYLEYFFNTHEQCWVSRAYVRSEYRRQGIFTKLIEALDNKRRGLPLALDTTPNNAVMLAALKKLGFVASWIALVRTEGEE